MNNIEVLRISISRTLDSARRAELGQYLTPMPIAEFMAGMFENVGSEIRLMDAGAGVGSLSIAFANRYKAKTELRAWEIDPLLSSHLTSNLESIADGHFSFEVQIADFIESAVVEIATGNGIRFTHSILNPPYRKISSDSKHRRLLRIIGIETVNLYAAFVALSIRLLEPGGQLVAIVPRSFCNGVYYRPFRRMLFSTCSLDRIHVFESRVSAFKDDSVLQENVIIKLTKDRAQGGVRVSWSQDAAFAEYRESEYSFSEIVEENDEDFFIHTPTGDEADKHIGLEQSLEKIGLDVCTGPVVDFRLRESWLKDYRPGAVPLVYPHHFSKGILHYPREHKKPNALRRSPEIEKWLMPQGTYVLVKRFSSKEEKKRVMAYVLCSGQLPGTDIGFENHWNVIHLNKRGLDLLTARGLTAYLNSSGLDRRFRLFSGHTQVNAADLHRLRYPTLDALRRIGCSVGDRHLSQEQLDALVEGELRAT